MNYERRLLLEGMFNLRDIGGYETTDGRKTKWRTLLRGDSPHNLNPDHHQTLLDLPLRTVLDLRRPSELTEFPNPFSGSPDLFYRHINLQTDDTLAATSPTLTHYYNKVLDISQTAVREVFEILAQPSAFPALIHCAVGKDRTGLLVAILLEIANVPTETIALDYSLSADNLAPLFSEYRRRAKEAGQDMSQFEHLLEARAELMLDTLSYLKETYGGARSYLQTIGITNDKIDYLAEAIVE